MATDTKRDYYEVLGGDRTASAEDMTTAFEKLGAAFRAAGKPRTIDDVEEIRAIATAYRVLSDPDKRRRYEKAGYLLPDESGTGDAWPSSHDTHDDWVKARDLVAAIVDGILAGLD